jgi:hypothetical protein
MGNLSPSCSPLFWDALWSWDIPLYPDYTVQSFREHLALFREHLAPFREHLASFREHYTKWDGTKAHRCPTLTRPFIRTCAHINIWHHLGNIWHHLGNIWHHSGNIWHHSGNITEHDICSTTQLVTRAPPLIPQHLCGIIEAKRSESLDNESCDRSASMMPRTCCGIKGGARVTNCV